jgi:glycosyltransferase involved in cell wall biosynthesis
LASLSLCIICKNERNNLPRLLDSVHGCFDEIHITDTGSTDGTLEWLKEQEAKGALFLHHFEWINDFAAARNYSFSFAKTDYSMWLDCDDVLVGKEEFISWKKNLMPTANYWFATYHYGLDEKGNPNCSFVRERAIKNGIGFKWEYFVHEGIPPFPQGEPVRASYAASWEVKHLRSKDDMVADKNRNLAIFENRKEPLNSRMKYYYGKELFEAQRPLEAFNLLTSVMEEPDLEAHDRLLCVQYAVMSAMLCNQFEKAIALCLKGVGLAPNRAEFYVSMGDCYLKLNRLDDAVPCFAAASQCLNAAPPGAVHQKPLFTNQIAYTTYPRNQLARICFAKGDIDGCKKHLEDAMRFGADFETGQMMAEIQKVSPVVLVPKKGSVEQVDEYVISALPIAPYVWDENIAKVRGVGGSETAAIEMARHLHRLSGKKVRVFNERQDTLEIDGVIYQPNAQVRDYFSKCEPKANIAWRHSLKLTEAPTYLWCHDLATPGFEGQDYDKLLCLSEFHKQYVKHLYKIDDSKIRVIRNGIDPARFEGLDTSKKNPNKIVFSSSPDRGLMRAVSVVEIARKTNPDLELHVFYGFDNMEKMGLHQQVSQMKEFIAARPFVKLHGNTQQKELVKHFSDAKVWLYPTDFLETYCITALEMLACRVRPVVRSWGALPYTLQNQPARIVDMDCQSMQEHEKWAEILLEELKVEQPSVDINQFSWESVAKEWLEWLAT